MENQAIRAKAIELAVMLQISNNITTMALTHVTYAANTIMHYIQDGPAATPIVLS